MDGDARRYLELVTRFNCAIKDYAIARRTAVGPDERIPVDEWRQAAVQLQPAARSAGVATEVFVRELSKPGWRDDLRPEIEDLIREMQDQRRFFDALATATTLEAWNAAVASQRPDAVAAERLRAALGLPPPPTADPSCP